MMAVAQLPRLEAVAVERIPAYLGSAVTILVLGAVALALGGWRFGLEDLGLGWPGVETIFVGTAAILLVAMILVLAFLAIGRIWGLQESSTLRDLLPRSSEERRLFALLSCCAGTGEELAYRGYGMLMVLELTGSPAAALLVANVPFALVHVYQGGVGVVRTYLLGLTFGLSFLATGNLWPAMIAHTGIDLLGGLVLGERLLGPATPSPVPDDAGGTWTSI